MNPTSFENVESKWVCFKSAKEFTSNFFFKVPEIRQHCPNVPIVVVGTKLDLRNDPDAIARLQEKDLKAITLDQGKQLGERIGAYAVCECSARTQTGLKDTFIKVIEAVLKPKDEKKGGKDGKKPSGGKCVVM